jgi:DNA polymerase I-like protein with 3'-5' exonuclease and polymerase domains
MRVVAFDTETALTLKGLQSPPLACLSWAERDGSTVKYGVVSRHDALPLFESWLDDPSVLLVGHNIAYDTVVCMNARERPSSAWGLGPSEHVDTIDLPFRQKIFQKYEAGLVHDTMIRERLVELSRGTLDRPRGYYGLGKLADRYFNMKLDKEDDSWRYKYGTLIPQPFDSWPEEALKYAHEDAIATLLCWEAQGGLVKPVVDTEAQTRAAFAFQLMRTWGMRTDPQAVFALENRLTNAYQEYAAELRAFGILRENGSQDMALTRQLVEQSYPGKPPLTKKGAIKTANEVVERCAHPALQHLAEFKDIQKVLKTFIPVVKRGTQEPICPYVNVLVKNGRTSYQNPNLQNLPRKGGVRECFVPRPGKVFVDVDYDTLEIRTLAQVLKERVGGNTLVDLYQKDPDFDPHTRLASQIMNISYQEGLRLKAASDSLLKDMRQMSKAGNFGYGGGMGPKTMIDYAWKSYGVRLTMDQSRRLREDWMRSIPEVQSYFNQCSMMTRGDTRATISQLFSGRVRGGMTFTDLANGWWSGLAADGAKFALWNISKACYALPESPLFGTRPVVYIHDEFMLEAEEERGHDVGMELARIAMESMQTYTPDTPSRASPQIMRRWYKDAEPAWEGGRLVPWEPQRRAA